MAFDRIRAPDGEYEIDDPTTRGDVALSRNRMWSHRLRKKWDMHLGKVPARDFMSTVELTEKVVYGSGILCWECVKLYFSRNVLFKVFAHAMTGSR